MVMLLAVASLATAVVDVLLPALTGEDPFGVLNRLGQALGPGYLVMHIFVHNLGLACVVPGIGILAAKYEKSPRNRRLAALILFAAVVFSLVVAIQYLVQARERFDPAVVVPLVAFEAAAVMMLAWPGYRVVAGFLPTPRIGWSLVVPARQLAPWFTASAIVLVTTAVVETAIITGAFA